MNTTETQPETIPNSVRECVRKQPHKNQYNKNKQLRIDTTVSTGYTRPRTHGLGIWKNPRVPMTIRVDKKLKLAFTEASKAFSGSTCSAIEYIMAAYVGCYRNQQLSGVHPELTMNIGEIKIERNLRERRKVTHTYTHEEEREVTEIVMVCGFKGCPNEPAGKAEFLPRKEVLPLCLEHLDMAFQNKQNWRVLP